MLFEYSATVTTVVKEKKEVAGNLCIASKFTMYDLKCFILRKHFPDSSARGTDNVQINGFAVFA